jgi:hypothetical protein
MACSNLAAKKPDAAATNDRQADLLRHALPHITPISDLSAF